MNITQDMFEFIQLLNKHEVEYVIIGAHALSHFGYPRYSGDLDILIQPIHNEAEKIIAVLDEFGFGSLNLKVEDFLNKDAVIQLGVEPNRIDILTGITGPDLDTIFKGKIKATFNGENVQYISKQHLIENKEATGRLKDLVDAEMLKKLP